MIFRCWSGFLSTSSTKRSEKDLLGLQRDLNTLQGYHWLGNIRELESVIERAVILSQGSVLQVLDRFDTFRKDPEKSDEGDIKALADLEQHHILQVLNKTGWRIEGKMAQPSCWVSIRVPCAPGCVNTASPVSNRRPALPDLPCRTPPYIAVTSNTTDSVNVFAIPSHPMFSAFTFVIELLQGVCAHFHSGALVAVGTAVEKYTVVLRSTRRDHESLDHKRGQF